MVFNLSFSKLMVVFDLKFIIGCLQTNFLSYNKNKLILKILKTKVN